MRILACAFLAIFLLISETPRAENSYSELEKILSNPYGDTIRIKLEKMLQSKLDGPTASKIKLELGKLAYAQGLYKKAYQLLEDVDNDTAYFFRALSARTLKMDSTSIAISSRIKAPDLRDYFGKIEEKGNVSQGKYYLQFGAFDEYNKANKLAERIKKRGLNAVVVKKEGLFFVRGGEYNTEEEAELEAETVVPHLIYKIMRE